MNWIPADRLPDVDARLKSGMQPTIALAVALGVTYDQLLARKRELETRGLLGDMTLSPSPVQPSAMPEWHDAPTPSRNDPSPKEALIAFRETCQVFSVFDAADGFTARPKGFFSGFRNSWGEARASILLDAVNDEVRYVHDMFEDHAAIYARQVFICWCGLERSSRSVGRSLAVLKPQQRKEMATTILEAARNRLRASAHQFPRSHLIPEARAIAITGHWLEASAMTWADDAMKASKLAEEIIAAALESLCV